MSLGTTAGQGGNSAIKVVVSKVDGTDWHAQLRQIGLTLSGPQNYLLRFRAKADAEHKVHINLCSTSLPASAQCFVDFSTQVGPSSWVDVKLPISVSQTLANVSVKLILGDTPTTTWIDDVSLSRVTNPVTRRNFTNGTVLVNQTKTASTVDLTSAGYCHLKGDQNPSLNSGGRVTKVTVPARDAVILKKCA
jgi:hypothetical protein